MPKDVKVTLHFYPGQDDDLIAWMESLHVSYGKKAEAIKDVLRQGLGSTISDKSFLTAGIQIADGLTSDERAIAERAMSETDGKISLKVLMGWGMGQGPARRLQDDWKTRGWAANDPTRKNGLYITPKLPILPTNLQTLQTPTNWPTNLQTDLQTPTNWPTNRQTDLTNPTNRLAAFMAANPVTKQEETPSASGPKKLSVDSEHW